MNTPTRDRHSIGFTAARNQLKSILDTSDKGGLTLVCRGSGSAAVVNSEMFRTFLISTVRPEVRVVHEDGAWAAFMPGLPFAAEGTTLDEAVTDLIDALRDYADDWQDHLHTASNHIGNWPLVQLIAASSDEQLTDWLTGAAT
ncbi:hypothetical protein [Arthrobacter sp. PAMC25284]|uniref:hypothetical protein n=1 Tax=Arthrobacter sp. PAMC25284 TaxID=2861279 RepID=UPI001C63494C|nr:hypothetical protein [Arthrobacter sp. PAMC25284]QYF88462.1 hypothetical protein KY499_09175 [Arthrobacter sp. PAMC25284]